MYGPGSRAAGLLRWPEVGPQLDNGRRQGLKMLAVDMPTQPTPVTILTLKLHVI